MGRPEQRNPNAPRRARRAEAEGGGGHGIWRAGSVSDRRSEARRYQTLGGVCAERCREMIHDLPRRVNGPIAERFKMRTIALGCWLLFAGAIGAQEPKPPTLSPEEQKLAGEATKLNLEGFQLYQQGKPAEAVEKMRRALDIRRKLYPAATYPDGHPAVAIMLNNLGAVLQAAGQLD